MEYYFINDNLKNDIKQNVVNKTFPSLNQQNKNLLLEYLINVIDIIAIKFNFDISKRELYENQFRQNNYRDAIGLLLMLLPYIEDSNNEKKNKLKSFNELYIAKANNIPLDINKTEPKYEYTNIQYNRCYRTSETDAKERVFTEDHLKHNYLLLLETIQSVANKLYVNWINIRPVDSANIGSLQAYIKTDRNAINRSITAWDFVSNDKRGRMNGGLDASEMYNIFSNFLYHPIKKIKWIIYDVYINDEPYRYTYILNNLLDISNPGINIAWNVLDESSKLIFKQQLNKLINLFINNEGYNELSSSKLSYVVRVLLTFFDKNYRYKTQAINDGYVEFSGEIESNEDNEEEDNDDISNLDLIKRSAKSLLNLPEHIYEYIRLSFNELSNTWYGNYFLKYDSLKKTYILEINKEPSAIELNPLIKKSYQRYFTIKNVYNYAKSLTHIVQNNRYRELPKFWKSLNDNQKKIVLDRLNSQSTGNVLSWFNIMRYLTKLVGLNVINAQYENIKIHENIQNSLSDILFDVLARMGLLSEFVCDPFLTNNKLLPNDTNEKNNTIQELLGKNVLNNPSYRQRWENSIYFINNLPYDVLDFTIKNNDNSIITYKYIDALSIPKLRIGGWVTAYALDWISQIGFYHHFINNKIIYITGATGVGKSTQTPKLLLYGLKAFDYKVNATIAGTQPRVPPTESTANIISKEMGVPIKIYNPITDNEIRSNNYYIQYKHKQASHEIKKSGLTLKIMTDGLLEAQLNNPILKRLYGDKYSTLNVYDIIIVDEAHEHNKNMDIILTKMKYVTYFNNDIRLIIVSATMEEDEPVYRRYYRDVNDNKMYPPNMMLEKYGIDRINVDRRIHISAPGETTKYTINEIYAPNENPIDIVMKILSTTDEGDILLFQPGRREIMETVEEINQKTPYYVIAIPYYSDMGETNRQFVDRIDVNKNNLTISKNVPFNIEHIDPSSKVQKGTYKRVIIVATNIAEASITINTLRYVIDTGTQKTSKFDYKTRTHILRETNISESSRLQRRGRVGRVAPGTVYYMYQKGTMEKNKRQFDISSDNLSDKFFDLLYDNPDESKLFDETNDPNRLYDLNLIDIKTKYKYGLDNMIRNQYFLLDNFFNYIGNFDHYDYQNSKGPYYYYQTGYDKLTIDDNKGEFYIVHPDELCFQRNIRGNIVDVLNNNLDCNIQKVDNQYVSNKTKSFWKLLSEYLLIVSEPTNKNIVFKTNFGNNIMSIKRNLITLSLQQIISLVYSKSYGCYNDMIKLLAMYLSIRSAKEIVYDGMINGRYTIKFEEALKLYGNCYGDSYALINIGTDIIKLFTGIINGSTNKNIDIFTYNINSSSFNDFQKDKELFFKNNYNMIDKNKLDQLIKMNNNNQLSRTQTLTSAELAILNIDKVNMNMYIDIIKNPIYIDTINEWCKKKLLRYTNVVNFFENYIRLFNELRNYDNQLVDIDNEITKRTVTGIETRYTPILIDKNTLDRYGCISVSLLHGFGYNLVKNISIINNTYFYISVFDPTIENIFNIEKLFKPRFETKRKILNNTFIKSSCLRSNILYISKSESDITGYEEMNLIENIPINVISKVLPYMYDPNKFNTTIQEKHVKDFLRTIISNNKKSNIFSKLTENYIKTINEIKKDLVNNYDKNIYEKMVVIDDRKNIRDIITNTYINLMKTFNGGGNHVQYIENKKIIDNNYINNLINYILQK